MATAESVKANLQSLITKANETTGNADADLTTAVDALVAGFGQGGGEVTVGSHKVLLGQATPNASGLLSADLGVKIYNVHSIIIWLDDTSVVSNYTTTAAVLSYTMNLYAKGNTHIDLVLNGTRKSYNKSAYAIELSGYLPKGTLHAESLTNSAYAEWWVLIPETYNYMVVYDE